MKIKTYTVSSLSEAIEQIKHDLGAEAVILSTKKVAGPGSWLSPKRMRLEVTAAVDLEPQTALLPEAVRPVNGQRMFQRIAEEQLGPIRSELQEIRDTLVQLAELRQAAAAVPLQVRETSGGVIPLVTRMPAPILRRTDDARSEQEVIADALAGVPDALPDGADQARTATIAALCQSLLWHQVDPEVVDQLATELTSGAPIYSPALVQEQAAAWLMQQLPAAKPFAMTPPETRVLALVGPTGSGKTTTLVKLGSQMLLEHKLRIGFITLDQFRVGAEEQLRKYAQILEVPCELAVDTLQFRTALDKFADLDVVLVDTTGRSPQDAEGLHRIHQTLQVAEHAWIGLTMPATLQGADLQHTLQQFSLINPGRLILTKLDEAISFGSLVNAPLASGLSPAYFTTGQQVPEDIEAATKERAIDCLLNLSGQFPVPEQTPVIGIASGKGGVGKSNIAVNLACALGRAGKKILLFDADFGLGNTDILLGITTTSTLADAWRDGQPLTDIAYPLGDGVTLIPSGSAQFALADADSLMIDGLLYELERYMQEFDLVIVDTGAGVHQRIRDTLLFCDQVVIVTTPDPTALTDSYATIKLVAQREPDKPFAVIVNMAERIADGEETFIQLSRVAEKYLKIQLDSWGVVPMDPRVPKAIRQQQAVMRCYPGTSASLAIARIAAKVARQPFAQPPRGIVRFLQQFFRPTPAMMPPVVRPVLATTA